MKLNLRKVEGKTRIVKKFIWFKRLEGLWKFFGFFHVLQKCEIVSSFDTEKKKNIYYLKWIDKEWSSEQTLFLKCRCGNELTSTGSFVSDTEDGVKYECTDCLRISVWNFDLFPIPVEITDGKYPSPEEMKCCLESEGKA